MKYISWIVNLDLLGNPIQFKLKGNEKYRTIFGGILTSIIVTLVSLLGINFFVELINRTNPLISLSTSYSPNIYIDLKNKFPLILYISYSNGSAIKNQSRIFDIIGFSLNFNVSSQNNSQISNQYTYLNITNCTENFISENYGSYSQLFINTIPSSLLNSNLLFCVKPPNLDNYSIYNSYGSVPFQTIQFFLTQCNNKTNKSICAPKEEINNALSNVQFNIMTPDIYFNHQNYENPGVSYLNNQVFAVSSTLYKRFFIYLKSVIYLSDNGIILSEVKNRTYFQLDKVNQEVFLSGVTALVPNSIANFCFTLQTNIFNIYSRKYTNIPQILASLGGAFNSMMIICLILNHFLEKILKELEIFDICCSQSLFRNKLKPTEIFQRNELDIDNNLKTNNYIKESLPNNSLDKSKGYFKSNDFLQLRKEIIRNFEFSRKSIIFDNPEIENLIGIKINFFEIIFPFLRSEKQRKKILVAKQFSNQIFEIDFILGNLLENQLYNLLKLQK